MAQYINPFDFRAIFINYFLGGLELFFFAFIIVMSYSCAKFGMSNKIFLTLLAVCSIIFAGVLGQAVYILIVFVIGLISFKAIGKIVT